jgi:uncharacterized membrane protein YobD (UPF0266 family)
MTITDLVLILFILVLLAFAIYDQFIMPRRNGPLLLAIPLLRRSRVDGIIFVGLIAILIYNNITSHGALITTWLLSALALMGFICSGSVRRKSSSNQRFFLRQYLDRI